MTALQQMRQLNKERLQREAEDLAKEFNITVEHAKRIQQIEYKASVQRDFF